MQISWSQSIDDAEFGWGRTLGIAEDSTGVASPGHCLAREGLVNC
ncbi:hypothetical protein XAP6164_670003 [Xanthomonas phaseoli pv. phaseoli]|nr:hypothetical protein XAP6164_670003 [Xanthomonas phaseoli pv. phaseoli]